jgi:hypothetical protein
MRSAIVAVALLIGLIPAWPQSPPARELSPGKPPVLGAPDEVASLRGTVVAYDWSNRYFMEGARIENFVFKTEGDAIGSKFVRVVLVWHPADSHRILPNDFYSAHRVWQ